MWHCSGGTPDNQGLFCRIKSLSAHLIKNIGRDTPLPPPPKWASQLSSTIYTLSYCVWHNYYLLPEICINLAMFRNYKKKWYWGEGISPVGECCALRDGWISQSYIHNCDKHCVFLYREMLNYDPQAVLASYLRILLTEWDDIPVSK